MVRPMLRSLFLLSLAVAPLATAGTSQSASTPSKDAVISTPADAVAAEPAPRDAAVLGSQVQDLEATVNGMRRELARLREEEDARVRVIGDPNNHPLWP